MRTLRQPQHRSDSNDQSEPGRAAGTDLVSGAQGSWDSTHSFSGTFRRTPAALTGVELERLRRRVAGLLARGLLVPPRGNLTLARALEPEELCEAYALVHDTFVQQRYIAPNARGMRIRAYELIPEMNTFVARLNGEVVGVLSTLEDSADLGLPSDAAFKSELDLLRLSGRRLIEITNLAIRADLRNSSVFLELARCITAHVHNQRIDDAFIAVSPSHAVFFQSILPFEAWGERRPYGPGDVVEGKHCNVHRFREQLVTLDAVLGKQAFLYDWFFSNNPGFELARASFAPARRRFLRPDTLLKLLGPPSTWLSRLPARELAAVARHWGVHAWQGVMPRVVG